MSKIFDALQKARGVLPDSVPRLLADQLTTGATADFLAEAEAAVASTTDSLVDAEDRGGKLRTVSVRPPTGAPVFPFAKGNSKAAEEYRMIRTRLVQSVEAGKLVMVTSPELGDGKTLSAINVAGALALKQDTNVLILDADLHRPAVAKTLGIRESPGLTEVLQDKCSLRDAIVRTDRFSNLYVLPAGASVTNRAELLDSPMWRNKCAALGSQFHYTVVDAPPIDAVSEYALIQGACDYLIVIIRPDHTNRSRCMRALESLPKDKFIGTIINAMPDFFLLRNSRYQYYGYYSYHDDETAKKAAS
jgi:capsular exopolysaccharide synthesis family protein